jgi:hypothetical protein
MDYYNIKTERIAMGEKASQETGSLQLLPMVQDYNNPEEH